MLFSVTVSDFLKPNVLPLMIPIVAIVAGCGAAAVVGVAKVFARHRERMALIERGIHPDLLTDDEAAPMDDDC